MRVTGEIRITQFKRASAGSHFPSACGPLNHRHCGAFLQLRSPGLKVAKDARNETCGPQRFGGTEFFGRNISIEIVIAVGSGNVPRCADYAAEFLSIRTEKLTENLTDETANAFTERGIGIAVEPRQRRRELTLTVDFTVSDAKAARWPRNTIAGTWFRTSD